MRRNAKITLGAAALGLAGLVAGPLSAAHAGSTPFPVPAGTELNFVAHVSTAPGVQHTQTYTCQNHAWSTGSVAEATLVDDSGEPVIHHFTGSAGPTWTSLNDGSTVVGKVINPATDSRPSPNANSIKELKLTVVSTSGPAGGDLSNTNIIQRLNTRGGKAPSTPCGADGTKISVDYSADYYFYTDSNSQQ
jgi:hypothetical protein